MVMAGRRRTWLVLLDGHTNPASLAHARLALASLPATLPTPTVFCVLPATHATAIASQSAVVGEGRQSLRYIFVLYCRSFHSAFFHKVLTPARFQCSLLSSLVLMKLCKFKDGSTHLTNINYGRNDRIVNEQKLEAGVGVLHTANSQCVGVPLTSVL